MGKKRGWISAIKRVFSPHSKEKTGNESERKPAKEKKKKGFGKLRHGETNSFLPLFREPSSIEKILGDAEKERSLTLRPPISPERPRPSTSGTPRITSPRVPSRRIASPRVPSPRPVSPQATSPQAVSPRAPTPRAPSPRARSPRAPSPRGPSPKPPSPRDAQPRREVVYRPEPTPRNYASATKIQAAYRGYMARRSFRALKGLVRLQGVVRGHNVKRQTMNAMKHMQLLVRVQTQIQSRRIQMLEMQARNKNDKEDRESVLRRWNTLSEAGNGEEWDDSLLTKEEKEARLHRKVDAIIKRERSMAYAYSNQLWRSTNRSAQTAMSDMRSGAFPMWWNWLEYQIPQTSASVGQSVRDFKLTPPRATSELTKPSPRPSLRSNQAQHFGPFDAFDTPTPKSTKSTILTPARNMRTPPSSRTPLGNSSSGMSRISRPRASQSPYGTPFKDDDSLTSCPPFSVPSYMAPTVSAKAKVRANSNPKERLSGAVTPTNEKRRMSFPPLSHGIGSFKGGKGSFFSGNKNVADASRRAINKNHDVQSLGNMSVDSTISMPAIVGRKPFNRFA